MEASYAFVTAKAESGALPLPCGHWIYLSGVFLEDSCGGECVGGLLALKNEQSMRKWFTTGDIKKIPHRNPF